MKRLTLITISLLIILTGLSFAQTQDQDIELEKIVVTPSRTQEEIYKSPGNVTVITRGQIERSKAKTVPELLNTIGSVIMRDYLGNGKTTTADIRGFGDTGSSNVLVLVDGRRVNNIDTSGTDWTQIPISMVDKIEILRGAASVMYGDNATGGVINIITKDPLAKKYEFKTGLITGSYATYGEKAEMSFNRDYLSAIGFFEQYRTDGYRINSDLWREDFNGKIIYSPSKNWKTKLSFGNHHDKYGLPGALTDNQMNVRGRRSSIYPDDFARSRDYFVDIGMEKDLDDLGKVQFDAARRKRDTFANLVATAWMTERDTITYTINPKYILDKKIFGYNNKFIAGLDYLDAEQDIVDGGYSGNPDKLTLSKKNYGLYLTDQFYINDKISFTGGYRHEIVHYNFEQEAAIKGSDQSKFKEDVYSSAINYAYYTDSNIYVSFSDSFRHPMVDEFYTTKYDFPGFGSGGGMNVTLCPQTANNYEIGIRHSFNKNFLIGITSYLMNIRHEIYYEPTTAKNSNYDRTVHRGIEFNTDIKLNEKIKFFGNYAFTDTYFGGGSYDKRKIPGVPSHKWGFGSDIKLHKFFNLSLVGNYVGQRYFINDQTNILPRMAAYFVFDTKLSFEKGNLSLFLAINNLFDEEYYEYGAANSTRTYKNYYPAAERNFNIGGSFKF